MSIVENLVGRLRGAFLIVLAALTPSADAELVRVEWFNPQCGALIVQTSIGYAYARQVSTGMLTVGDMLDGDFERDARLHEVQNTSNRTTLSLWVEKFSSDKKSVLQVMPAHCRPELPAQD